MIGVGGTTEGGCIGNYSLAGKDVDLVAPGGGEPDATLPLGADAARSIQVTFRAGNERRFGEPTDYVGTSMAAAHVSGRRGDGPRQRRARPHEEGRLDRRRQVATRLKKTARSLGISPLVEGAGLIDAARATDPECQLACFSHRP